MQKKALSDPGNEKILNIRSTNKLGIQNADTFGEEILAYAMNIFVSKKKDMTKYDIAFIKFLSKTYNIPLPDIKSNHRLEKYSALQSQNLLSNNLTQNNQYSFIEQSFMSNTYLSAESEESRQELAKWMYEDLNSLITSNEISSGFKINMLAMAVMLKYNTKGKFILTEDQDMEKYSGGEYGNLLGYYNNKNTSATVSDVNVQTLIHEGTHFLCNSVFNNDTNPYFQNDMQKQQSFEEAVQKTFQKVNGYRFFQDKIKNYVKDLHEGVKSNYPQNEHNDEYIVRYFELLAQFHNTPEHLKIIKDIFTPLTNWIKENYLPNLIDYIKEHTLDKGDFTVVPDILTVMRDCEVCKMFYDKGITEKNLLEINEQHSGEVQNHFQNRFVLGKHTENLICGGNDKTSMQKQ